MPESSRDAPEKAPMLQQPPIPSYEEAVASFPSADAADASNDESRGLLERHQPATASGPSSSSYPHGYRPPTVESVRSSSDSSFLEDFVSARSSEESLQRELIEMEVMDADDGAGARSRSFGISLSKRLSSIPWPSISLPRNLFRGWRIPELPQIPWCANNAALVPVYRLFGVLVALVVLYALIASNSLTLSRKRPPEYNGPYKPSVVRDYALRNVEHTKIAHWMEYLSSFDHVAGTEGDYTLAKYIQGEFASFGMVNTERVQYNVYLNYPKKGGRRVWMDEPKWEAKLEESVLDKHRENTLVYHGLAKGGSAKGPLVYANYGSRKDFEKLEEMGVSVKGAVVLVRYGGTQKDPGLKVKAAQDKGAVGCLMYADPGSEGWEWPGDAVKRESVGLKSWVVGDVTTPGWASKHDSERVSLSGNKGLVQIPSLPLNWNDARNLLQALKGKGKKGDASWTGHVKEVLEYWTGSLDSSPTIHLQNDQVEKDQQPIWNVFGVIPGTDRKDMEVVVGNHRDAWCFGASDPNSGTAIMLEVARVFGEMMEAGWRPLRTIRFANWDASAYNLIGSTEWVEESGDHLRQNTLAYINLDAAVTGTSFSAAGTPSLRSALLDALSSTTDPIKNDTLATIWGDKPLPGLGNNGDWVPFYHHDGIPSIDLKFTGPGFPAHSCYDSYALIKRKDPYFQYHKAMARVVAVLVLDLADHPIAKFEMDDYEKQLQDQVSSLTSWVHKKVEESSGKGKLDLGPLNQAIEKAKTYFDKFAAMAEPWMELNVEGMYNLDDEWSVAARRARSMRMSNFDKHLLDLEKDGGIPRRKWFRHLLATPEEWNGGENPEYFPAVREAVERGEWGEAQKQLEKVATLIERAARKLLDEMS